jgi:hypothetical protein
MRIFIENIATAPSGNRKPLGTYVDVVVAIHRLFPKRKWHTARKGIGVFKKSEIEIFLTTRLNKNAPPSLERLLFPLLTAKIESELFLDIDAALVIPDELINIVIFNNSEAILPELPKWTEIHNWRAKHWPDGPEIK